MPQSASNVALAPSPVPASAEVEGAWRMLRDRAAEGAAAEPILAPRLDHLVLSAGSFGEAVARRLAELLQGSHLPAELIRDLTLEAAEADPSLLEGAARDLRAHAERDPAVTDPIQPFLFAKGFPAVQAQRVSHCLWLRGRTLLALTLHDIVGGRLSVDIHPGARLGHGIFIDHGHGVVIGETAVVEDDVSMLHGVTLGGDGKERGDRHPKVRRGVLIGAGAKILGNIVVGEGARVAAGSIVLSEVPPHVTVAGIPAKPVGRVRSQMPSLSMEHSFTLTTTDFDWSI
jgi:serine O-acetyltransferase